MLKRRSFLGRLGTLAGSFWITPVSAAATPASAAQFRLPRDFAYFNTAGLGASPTAVTDVVKARMDREEENPAPGHSEDDFRTIRRKCAALLGPRCRAQDIAFMSTATEGLNAILNSIPLTRGDEVVTSTHEHAGLVIPLLHKMQTTGCVVRTFEPDLRRAGGNLDRIGAVTNARTRLIILSHVTCTTGQLMPVAEIGRFANDRRIVFALDGAQSLAHVPFDISETGAHYYAASCHKWMMGPKRTGVLYVHPDRQATAVPTVVGAYSDQASNLVERTLTLRPNAERFEYGTQNDALIYGLEAAADYLSGLGLQTLWRRNTALAERFLAALKPVPGIDILSPADAASRTAILTFRIGSRDNRTVASALVARRLRVRSVTEGGLDAVRASFHVCNDDEQVDRLIDAVKQIAALR